MAIGRLAFKARKRDRVPRLPTTKPGDAVGLKIRGMSIQAKGTESKAGSFERYSIKTSGKTLTQASLELSFVPKALSSSTKKLVRLRPRIRARQWP